MSIGYGKDFTVLEYHQMAAEVMGYDGEFAFDTTRPVGMTNGFFIGNHHFDISERLSDLKQVLEDCAKAA